MNCRLFVLVPAFVCGWQSIASAQPLTFTLEAALARARADAPSVLVARARIEESRGRLAGARVRYRDNPIIDVGAGPRDVDGTTLTDFDLGVVQVFETGGQRSARIAGAEAEVRREAATADESLRRALRDVAGAWLRTLYGQERVALLGRAENVASDIASVASRRNQAGDIAILDVNVVKSALARARAARVTADAERALASGELQRLLGLPRGQLPAARGSFPRSARADLVALIAAVDSRPDLQALRAEMAGAEADVRLGRAASRPDVGVGARFRREEGNPGFLGELSLIFPVFSRGQELLATGSARLSRARMELETTRAAAVAEVETLFATAATRQAALTALEQDALPGLDENDALAQRSFDVGQISLPELMVIRRELLETRLEYLDRQLEAAEAAVAVDAAAGVLR